ncbi:MAG TPA: hypothetical protein DCE44_11930 [Verrucomicrobiales bacterium]|nr:hypothetical protein [Verrucomicrobiales bacterium]
MGPMHGKVIVHLPSKAVGIARSRIRSGFGNDRAWEYSLLLGSGERTPFFPERQFGKATSEQAIAYLHQRTLAKASVRQRSKPHSNSRLCQNPDSLSGRGAKSPRGTGWSSPSGPPGR